MRLVPDDALEAWHLAEALDRWSPLARAAGMPVPQPLLAWAEACRLRARRGQDVPTLDDFGRAPAHSLPMRLLLPLEDAAGALGVSERMVKRLVADGDLPSVKLERRRLVHVDDLCAYAERLRHDQESRPCPASPSGAAR